MDVMPEIMDGKNVADFIDPDIAEKLEALEREEEKLQEEGFYDSEQEIVRLFLTIVPPFTNNQFPLPSSTLMTNEKP
jgi:NOGCT (NUC087) domain